MLCVLSRVRNEGASTFKLVYLYRYLTCQPKSYEQFSCLFKIPRTSLGVSPPEDSLLPSQLLRHGFLPRQSHDVLEERRRGAPRGRGPRGDPPQPRRILPDERRPEAFIGRTRRLEEVRLCVSSPRCGGRHRHQTGQSADQDQLG